MSSPDFLDVLEELSTEISLTTGRADPPLRMLQSKAAAGDLPLFGATS